MKEVMLSIQPKWCELIASGKKTVDIRKSRPKIDTPFKCYIYMTMKKPYCFEFVGNGIMEAKNGKVIGEFACDRIDKYNTSWLDGEDRLLPLSCLNDEEIMDYMNGYLDKMFYAWYISDLKIYDEPKELSEFRKAGFLTEEEWLFRLYPNTHCHYEAWAKRFELIRPPQSWCFVEEIEE
jgi:predicted transcriptional regulator